MFMTVLIQVPIVATAIFIVAWLFAILVVIVLFTAPFFSAALFRAYCSAFDVEIGLIFVKPHCDGLLERLAGNGTS